MDGRPLVRGIKRAAAASFLASLQSAIDDSWMLHPCFNVEGVFDPSERGVPASNLPPREVIYWGLEFTGKLTIPEWSCHHQGCSSPDQSITPHALTFCCFPSTPSFPSVWFDLSVMHTPIRGSGRRRDCQQQGSWMPWSGCRQSMIWAARP